MPELPEVATYQKHFSHAALHQKVVSLEVYEPRMVRVDTDALAEGVVGRTLVDTDRIGKHLLVKLDNDAWLTLHFGMTGSLQYFRDRDEAPRFTKLLFGLSDGWMAFRCPRILGRVGLTDDLEAFRKERKLGQDALKISLADFRERWSGRKGLVKPLLLNQAFVAGLGNWIVDEMLYQAHIHPETPANLLSEETITTLYEKMRYILETAVKHEARYEDFPQDFLVTYRWLDRKNHPLQQKNIERIVVGGRGTYYCPDEQLLPEVT